MAWILLYFSWACLFHVAITTYVFWVMKKQDSIFKDHPFILAAQKIVIHGSQILFVVAAILTYELYVEGLALNGFETISAKPYVQYGAIGGLILFTVLTVPGAFYLRYLEYKAKKSETKSAPDSRNQAY